MRRVAIIAVRAVLVTAVSMVCIPLGTLADAQAEGTGKPAGDAVVHPGDGVIGEWWTENRVGRIRFVRHTDGSYRGITTWRVPNAPPKDNPPTDLYNPNPKLRGRPTLGIVLVSDLKYESGRYVDGRVYNPRDGDTYGFKAQLLDKDTLKIRGFMGISLFGWNQIWKRYFPEAGAP